MRRDVLAMARPGPDLAFERWLEGELRSDHAGETGAVWIYRGVLAVSRDPAIRQVAELHIACEAGHVRLLEDELEPRRRSRLLPLWRLMGWVTGAVPAAFGPRAVFATVAAVETFVDEHYEAQIRRLRERGGHDRMVDLLETCRGDEARHRDEARLLAADPGPLTRLWTACVEAGSALGVALARRV
jgi:ubiquinone biosynthesis monooxygenase Coq7